MPCDPITGALLPEEPSISNLMLEILPASVSPSILNISVVPNLTTSRNGVVLTVTWSAQPGAVSYTVYASPSPTTREVFMTGITTTTVDFSTDITFPPDTIWHFWVEVLYSTAPIGNRFIQAEPVWMDENTAFAVSPLSVETETNYISNFDMKYYCEEIRRRHKAILENDAEPFYLYVRRWEGVPCPCRTGGTGTYNAGVGTVLDKTTARPIGAITKSKDPDYQAVYNCDKCFGTGILGGYYARIPLSCRYGETPFKTVRWMKQGLDVSEDFNSWTLWFPIVHEHDVIVRSRTGQRFRLQNVAHPKWRGITTWQRFNSVLIPTTDIAYKLTDAKILEATDEGAEFDTAEFGWSSFA